MSWQLQLDPELLVRTAGCIHFVQMPFMILLARRMRFAEAFAALSPLAKQLVVTFTQGIALCITGLGIVVVINAGSIVAAPLGRDLLWFLFTLFVFRTWTQWSRIGKAWPGGSRALHYALMLLHGSIMTFYGSAGAWLVFMD